MPNLSMPRMFIEIISGNENIPRRQMGLKLIKLIQNKYDPDQTFTYMPLRIDIRSECDGNMGTAESSCSNLPISQVNKEFGPTARHTKSCNGNIQRFSSIYQTRICLIRYYIVDKKAQNLCQ